PRSAMHGNARRGVLILGAIEQESKRVGTGRQRFPWPVCLALQTSRSVAGSGYSTAGVHERHGPGYAGRHGRRAPSTDVAGTAHPPADTERQVAFRPSTLADYINGLSVFGGGDSR